jgi:hypothetical protein
VLDALDECREDDRRTLITLLCDFHQRACTIASENVLKFLVTSRPYDSCPALVRADRVGAAADSTSGGEDENDKIHEEINLVIEQRVNELATNLPPVD